MQVRESARHHVENVADGGSRGRRDDADVLLRETARILRPGGCLVVDVPQTFHYYTLGKKLLIALDLIINF